MTVTQQLDHMAFQNMVDTYVIIGIVLLCFLITLATRR